MPLISEEEDRNAATLIPLITKKYILPGWTKLSDGRKVYALLVLKASSTGSLITANFIDPENKQVHTQNKETLWRGLKEWAKQPGLKSEYFEQ